MKKGKILRDLTVANTAEVLEVLKEGLKKAKEGSINLSEVERIDLSGIQLLISAQKSAEKGGSAYCFTGELNEDIYQKVVANGFCLCSKTGQDDCYNIRRTGYER